MGKKQPKLVLREGCVEDVIQSWPIGSFIEMGAGLGGMTRLFLDWGFHGVAYDLGEDSRDTMRHNLKGYGDKIQVFDQKEELGGEKFDYLLAFEVLEHIDDDLSAIREWTRHLRSGGRVLISVPAHEKKYGKSDEIVGHVRRYEKEQLERLLVETGYSEIRIINYGFPITELTRRLSNRLIKDETSYDDMSMEERSISSARKKPKIISRLLSIFGGNLFAPFKIVQRWFYHRDWGDGYVATAVKR